MKRMMFALALALVPPAILHAQPLLDPCPADPSWVGGWQILVCKGACYWWLPGSWFGC